jgi:hypothetical protein
LVLIASGSKKVKSIVTFCPPPFVEMNRFAPDVKCEKERSAAREHPVQLSEHGGQRAWSEVNDRIKSDDPRQARSSSLLRRLPNALLV